MLAVGSQWVHSLAAPKVEELALLALDGKKRLPKSLTEVPVLKKKKKKKTSDMAG